MSKLDLLILADLHYVGQAAEPSPLPQRLCKLGLELAVRAIRDGLRNSRPDAILVLGDLVERGDAPGAMDDLAEVRRKLGEFDVPLLVVPGNHDVDVQKAAGMFGWPGGPAGCRELNGHQLVLFVDHYDQRDVCRRPPAQMEALSRARAAGPPGPIVALQHNPLLPRIESSYPYTITDAEELAAAYARAGVCLSISGHYHAGLPPLTRDGVTYVTCPAMCEAPFRYTRLVLIDGEVESVETIPLAPPQFAQLFDAHVHTEFAYCAEDISADAAIERANAFGVGAIGLCEHADQLYFPRENFWKRLDADDPAAIARNAAQGHARHEAYRRRTRPLRSDRIFLGLEIEPAATGGGLAILDRDRRGYDYVIGSIHHLAKVDDAAVATDEIHRRFLARTEQAIRGGIDVLGHPFRYFPRYKRPTPPELFEPVADLLAECGVAAEINFHHNRPEAEFFAMCLERGVKLAIGSDSHSLTQVADLRPHLEFLGELGVLGRLDEVLWRPGRTVECRMSNSDE